MRRPLAALLLSLSAAGAGGCIQMAQFWANVTGGDWIEPEYKLTKGPLLVMIDDLNNQITEPQVIQETHRTISEIFAAKGVNERVIPLDYQLRLARSDKEYPRLKIRQIGEKLGAEEVLYVNVVRFTTHDEPGADFFKGNYTVRVKVISTRTDAGDVRKWPSDSLGKQVAANTPPEPSDGDRSSSDVARELAIKVGQGVSRLFYGYRELEEK